LAEKRRKKSLKGGGAVNISFFSKNIPAVNAAGN